MQAEKPKVALIATVGKTLEPIEITVIEHEPDFVVLIASEDTMGVASNLRERFAELAFKTLLLNEPEDLTETFRIAREALSYAKKEGATQVIADITGGTKPMTAGLVLALSGLGVIFSYVGGEKRDPKTGRVITGSERVRLLEDPTARFHELEWQAFKTSWNAWRMDSAAAMLGRILANPELLTPAEQKFYQNLLQVTRGLSAWDRFQHVEALEAIEEGLPIAFAIAEAWRHGNKVRVLKALEEYLPRLKRLVEKRGKPTMGLLADLLANAERRAESGRYDDAVARLYRALELAAEADLYTRTGIVLSDPSTWPETLGKVPRERAQNLFGLSSVLDLAFDIDLRLGHQGTLAQRLRGKLEDENFNRILYKRHRSILAHGTEPVNEEDYQAFLEVFKELALSPAEPWPRW